MLFRSASRCSFITDLETLTQFEFYEVAGSSPLESRSAFIATIVVESTIMTRVLDSQQSDPDCIRWKKIAESDTPAGYSVDSSGGLRFRDRLIVPNAEDIRHDILHEAHKSKYTVHPGGTKMY